MGNCLYRIYTEDKDRDIIYALIGAYYDGFTVLPGIGFWKGGQEKCLVIEIIGCPDDMEDIEILCKAIRETNAQQAVMLTVQEVTADLL
jgi:hypothetical protein